MKADRTADLLTYLDRRNPGFDRDGLLKLSREIAETSHERDAPVREIMSRLGDRWSSLIIVILATGCYRHAALRRVIAAVSAEAAISQRMLTLRLRALERDGLVSREIEPTVPPTVSYALTPLGVELAARLHGMIGWIKENEGRILEARRQFAMD